MTILRLDPDAVQWSQVDGDVIALDLRNGRYLAANPSATLLWPMLARGATSDVLVQALRERWDLAEEQALRDLGVLVAWLRGKGLLLEDPS